jgi:hypothetical protein
MPSNVSFIAEGKGEKKKKNASLVAPSLWAMLRVHNCRVVFEKKGKD